MMAPNSPTEVPQGTIHAFPSSIPMPAVTRILGRFKRPQVEAFISVAIELLDTLDGDPDAEANGDELEGSGDEQDAAWLEWHKLHGPQKRRPQIASIEDQEDDDADSGVDDQGELTDEREAEDYIGGGGLGDPNHAHLHVTA